MYQSINKEIAGKKKKVLCAANALLAGSGPLLITRITHLKYVFISPTTLRKNKIEEIIISAGVVNVTSAQQWENKSPQGFIFFPINT